MSGDARVELMTYGIHLYPSILTLVNFCHIQVRSKANAMPPADVVMPLTAPARAVAG
jgi:hypothetical protein